MTSGPASNPGADEIPGGYPGVATNSSRLGWLAFLYVSQPHRRRGAARALWSAAVDLAATAGAESIYVSAVPTGSAVGFYLSQGCRLADPVHPLLFAKEPEDIHLVRSLS